MLASGIGTNYTQRRKLVNEDDLVDKLIKEDYVEVFTERLSTIEKIAYFAVIFVFGTFTNMVGNFLLRTISFGCEMQILAFSLSITTFLFSCPVSAISGMFLLTTFCLAAFIFMKFSQITWEWRK